MSALAVSAHWKPDIQRDLFRRLLQAISYPGDIQAVDDLVGHDVTAIAVLAALVDDEVSFADPHGILDEGSKGFLSAQTKEVAIADYILADASHEATFRVKNGTIYRPEESATLILMCLEPEDDATTFALSGPGIESSAELKGDESLAKWLAWRESHLQYPQGIDIFICRPTSVIGLPRTTKISRGNQ